jgi:sugar O-acyltransferase (sialic acid O-acetyltransferase NeuD family)
MGDAGTVHLVGGGGHALVVLDAARAAGFDVTAFWDDDPRALLCDALHRAGSIADLADTESDARIIIAIGGIASRRHIIDKLAGRAFATIVHPRAVVSPTATIAHGVSIGPGAVVNPRAVIGAHAIINSGAIVEHECTVGENTHLAPRATLGGGAIIGADTLVGLGASVLPQVRIGDRCVIAGGAVVIHQIPDRTTAVGVPARARSMGGAMPGMHGFGI